MDKRIRDPRIYRGIHHNLKLNVCATLTRRSENDNKRSGVHTPNNDREFKQIHGNQYKQIHLRLEEKMATTFRERILRAMFVNSNILQPWSRHRVKRQGVFALTVMANIQRTPHS